MQTDVIKYNGMSKARYLYRWTYTRIILPIFGLAFLVICALVILSALIRDKRFENLISVRQIETTDQLLSMCGPEVEVNHSNTIILNEDGTPVHNYDLETNTVIISELDKEDIGSFVVEENIGERVFLKVNDDGTTEVVTIPVREIYKLPIEEKDPSQLIVEIHDQAVQQTANVQHTISEQSTTIARLKAEAMEQRKRIEKIEEAANLIADF